LSDLSDKRYAADMVLERDRSGLTIYTVLEQRLSLATVVIMDGAYTTVDITRMCQSDAPARYLRRRPVGLLRRRRGRPRQWERGGQRRQRRRRRWRRLCRRRHLDVVRL